MIRSRGDTIVSQTALTTVYSYDLATDLFDKSSLQVIYSDATPGAKTFLDAAVNTTTDIITISAHGFFTGLKVAATTNGTLPGGLSATNYWVIVVSASTIKLASSLANASAGTAVDITSAAGGGTHTLTPATLSNVVKIQESNDGTNFADVVVDADAQTPSVTITSAGNKVWKFKTFSRYLRVLSTPTSGALTFSVVLNARS